MLAYPHPRRKAEPTSLELAAATKGDADGCTNILLWSNGISEGEILLLFPADSFLR